VAPTAPKPATSITQLVGSGGALTGYAGGVERKAWLLRHEGALAPLLA